ncbi:MAG: TlyA family RNA methyltransferase [Anaerofustis sp.]
MNNKKRLDTAIYERGLTESREKAKSLTMAGLVYLNGQKADKPGTPVSQSDRIEIKGNDCPYVSRGGLKLEKALDFFLIDPNNKIAIDIGASSGGFTDCLLQHGAREVYAIDVGYGQIAYSLRQDPRVHLFEKTNFRYMSADSIIPAQIAVMDVSFISITKLADNLKKFITMDSDYISLIKPQFESEKDNVGKKGIISDPKMHIDILQRVISDMWGKSYFLQNLTYSPVKGSKGNIEFLAHFKLADTQIPNDYNRLIVETVKQAHEELS